MIQEIYIIDDDESSILVFEELFKNDKEYYGIFITRRITLFVLFTSVDTVISPNCYKIKRKIWGSFVISCPENKIIL